MSILQSSNTRAPNGGAPAIMPADNAPPPGDRLLVDRPAVLALTGLTRASLHTIEQSDPTFPQRVVLTERLVRWYRDEVIAWIAARPRGVGHVEKPKQLMTPGRPPASRARNRKARGAS